MAQTGYTPILIYSSSTVSQAPAAGNLTNSTLGSELAINITDGKLFYKDNANAVQVIAWKVTPTTAGGTGLTSYTAGDLLYYATGTTLAKLTIGASTTVLTSSGTAPQWTAQSSLSVGTAANLLSNATTGVMQIVGPGAGTTRVMTIPNANFTAARTDAAQTFSGDQTFSNDAYINTVRVGRGGTSPHSSNTCVGNGALAVQSGGFGATAIGSNALAALTSGQQIVAVGSGALATSTSGQQSVAVGHNALNLTTASNQTAIGYQAGAAATSGSIHFAGGSNALSGLTTGSAIGIGVNAGNNLTTGTNGIYIGTNSQPGSVSATNEIVVGTGTTGGGSNTTTLGTSSTTNTIIPAGNVTFSAAAKGVNFTANTPAAGMTSQLLNWYEEGTWTPTLTCSDGNFTSVTYDPLRGGSYTRIGNMVHVQVYMRTDAVDNTVGRTGDVLIGGLPFSAVAGVGGTLSGHCSLAVSVASAWTGDEPIGAFISGGDNNIQLLSRSAVNGNTSNITATAVNTGANANIVLVAGTYICA